MIQERTVRELEIALAPAMFKAQAVHPVVEIVKPGEYRVESSKGFWYTVKCGVAKPSGKLFVACSCDGSKYGVVCYHAYRAFEIHRLYMKFLTRKNETEVGI